MPCKICLPALMKDEISPRMSGLTTSMTISPNCLRYKGKRRHLTTASQSASAGGCGDQLSYQKLSTGVVISHII